MHEALAVAETAIVAKEKAMAAVVKLDDKIATAKEKAAAADLEAAVGKARDQQTPSAKKALDAVLRATDVALGSFSSMPCCQGS